MKSMTPAAKRILDDLMHRYTALTVCEKAMSDVYELLIDAFDCGGTLYVAGNGGSAADSEHIAGELMKAFRCRRPIQKRDADYLTEHFGQIGKNLSENIDAGLPVVPLPSLLSLSTAVVNDVDGGYVFAQALNALAKKDDVFLGISTSGNSLNIINALMIAKTKGMHTIGLCGKRECRMDALCDVIIHAPEEETYKVQEYHLPIYHALCLMIETRYWGE